MYNHTPNYTVQAVGPRRGGGRPYAHACVNVHMYVL